MDMIERVAKAIGSIRAADLANYRDQRLVAMVAIEAMRAPTEAMIAAGLAEVSDVTVSEPKAAAWDAIRFYRAMLDAALSTVPPGE